MPVYTRDSDSAVLVIHEIYGVNQHIVNVCNGLSNYNYDVFAANLLDHGRVFRYDQEQQAYNYFMNNIGFENGLKTINQILCSLRPHYKKVYVLGYSIGATLAWLSSRTGYCDKSVCFYGSRIREHLAVVPRCPVLLFFPSEERSFCVDELITNLRGIKNTHVIKLKGKHGFADQFSQNYHKASVFRANREILTFIKHS